MQVKRAVLATRSHRELRFEVTQSDSCPAMKRRVDMGLLNNRDSRLLIDGKLVAGSAGTFPTVNPATEEVLGVAADADAADMGRAIEAARRAFDETTWSTDHAFRVRCIRQLRDALREHIEELRELTIAEVGAPLMLTAGAQLEGPVEDLAFSADTAENFAWNHDLAD